MIVIDNGAYSIKVTDDSGVTHVVPNCIARSKDDRRLYTANELDDKTTLSTIQFKRAHEKGYLTAWHIEKAVWDQLFKSLYPDLTRDLMILTEAPNTPSTIQSNTDEMVFDEYGFTRYIRTTSPALLSWSSPSLLSPAILRDTLKGGEEGENVDGPREVILVVDSGYSFTHVTPVIHGRPGPSKRLDIGGKFLTNVLKEQISFRQYNMMDETALINTIKESCCFVSLNFDGDMERARKRELRRQYVLPDLIANVPGYPATNETVVTDDMQILELGVELFAVPELLFRPSDAGMAQGGIVEATMQALAGLPDEIVALALENIVLVGGNTKFPGFKERYVRDLRALAPAEFEVRVQMPDDPITFTSQCGHRLSQQYIEETQVTRDTYTTSNKRATMKFNHVQHHGQGIVTNDQSTLEIPRRRETIYDETSDRSDTPRSFSPDTEPEDQEMVDAKEEKQDDG